MGTGLTAAETAAADRRGPDGALGLYIHIPFCQRKCVYCDFNTYAGLEHLFQRTVEALCTEIRIWGERLRRPAANTVFLGGGTPTVLPPADIERLLDAVRTAFDLRPGAEITSEANPNSVDAGKFAALVKAGVNRISIGAQSFQQRDLDLLGRWHGADAIAAAVDAARAAGLDNINLDLIHGVPGQSLEDWAHSLDRALALDVEHLSLYSLTVETGTPLARMVETGRVDVPNDDLSADQYLHARDRLADAGYVQYEIANWARVSSATAPWDEWACRHNLKYWRNQDYLGFGPGAHSHLRRREDGEDASDLRWWNRNSVPGYIRDLRADGSSEADRETLSPALAQAETLMLGLRLLREGVTCERFARWHGQSLRAVHGDALERLRRQGLVQILPDRIRLTERGVLFHNHVSSQLLPA